MIAYKGFNKDLTCRGFQYEVGKTYVTDKAIPRKSGFHACLDPLDCLYHYTPESSVYYIVDIEDIQVANNDTTLICGKKITVLAQMKFEDIYDHHKKYIESVENNSITKVINCKTVAKENYNIILGYGSNCISGISYNLVNFVSYNSLAFRDRNAICSTSWNHIVVEDNNAIRCEYHNAISVENENIIEVGDDNSVCIISYNSLFAGYNNNISGKRCNCLVVGSRNTISLDNYNNIIAIDNNIITTDYHNSISAGKNCSITAGCNSIVKADIGSVITLKGYSKYNYITVVVDGEHIKSNTWYTLIHGKFTVASDEIIKKYGV